LVYWCAFVRNTAGEAGGAHASSTGSATAIRETNLIHCTIFENYSRFAGALQVPPSTTTRLLNSLLHGNESRETPVVRVVAEIISAANLKGTVGTVVVSGTNHQSGAFASGITPAADSYSAVPRMAWDGIHLSSPTATNGQSLLGRTVVAHTLTTNPIGMGATPPTDWDNELLTANANSSTVVPSESGCDDWRDSDSDQLPDWYETHIAALSARDGLNSVNELTPSLVLWGSRWNLLQMLQLGADPGLPDASQADNDGDGLTDPRERQLLTQLYHWDSDGDGMADGWEDRYNLDPRSATGSNGAAADIDGDGLINGMEYRWGTNPLLANTDETPGPGGDAVNDAQEIAQGSDPNDSSDKGAEPAAGDFVTYTLTVCDCSGSNSETWETILAGEATGPPILRLLTKPEGTGSRQPATQTLKLRKGKSYSLSVWHRGSKVAVPDYDWSLTATSGGEVYSEIEDVHQMLGEHNNTKPIAGRAVHITVPSFDAVSFRVMTAIDGLREATLSEEDPKDHSVAAESRVLVGPQWSRFKSQADPFMHLVDSEIEYVLTFEVLPSSWSRRKNWSIGLDGVASPYKLEKTVVTSSGQSISLRQKPSVKTRKQVAKINPGYTMNLYQVDNGVHRIRCSKGVGSLMYSVLDLPVDANDVRWTPTVGRIDKAVRKLSGASKESDISQLVRKLQNAYTYNFGRDINPKILNAWTMSSLQNGGDCGTITRHTIKLLKAVGVDAKIEAVTVWSEFETPTLAVVTPLDGTPNGCNAERFVGPVGIQERHFALLVDGKGLGNRYEACARLTVNGSVHYIPAAGGGSVLATPQEVLEDVFTGMAWFDSADKVLVEQIANF
jgi:hypothetical protein